jgi:hypothetical protein
MNLNSTDHVLFAGWAAVCLVSPFIGWLVARSWRSSGSIWRLCILAACLISFALAACTLFAPWSLRGFWANAADLAVAFVSLSVLIWLALSRCPRWLSVLGPVLIQIALVVPVFIGLVFSDDQIPFREMRLSANVDARIYRKRFPGTDFDEMTVVHRPGWLPVVEHTIYRRNIKYWECTSASARMAAAATGDVVQIVCGQQVMDTIVTP